MKPIIGINVDIDITGNKEQACVQANYYRAVEKAGGIPVLVPPMGDDELAVLLPKLDGLMLIGGADYSPSLYGESAHQKVKLVQPPREDWDMRLVHRAVNENALPILGICAGCQALNIGLGGSLVQDIPDEFPNSSVVHSANAGCWEHGFNKHTVKLSKESKLARIYGETVLDVPTSHHQSVRKPASAFRPVAFADDGVIEAIENPDRPFLIGVQWHPERDFDTNRKLFEAFVQAANRLAATVK